MIFIFIYGFFIVVCGYKDKNKLILDILVFFRKKLWIIMFNFSRMNICNFLIIVFY